MSQALLNIDIKNLVTEDEVLLFRLIERTFEGPGESLQVLIVQPRFRFYHGDVPDGTFGVRGVALRRAESGPGCEKRHAGCKSEIFFHDDWFLIVLTGS